MTHRPRRSGRQTGARPKVILHALFELGLLFRELKSRDGGQEERAGQRNPQPIASIANTAPDFEVRDLKRSARR